MPEARAPQPPPVRSSRIWQFLQIIAVQFFVSRFLSPKKTIKPTIDENGLTLHHVYQNIWPDSQSFDLSVYISQYKELPYDTDFLNKANLLQHGKDIVYGKNAFHEENITIQCPKILRQNGSMWAHVFFTRSGLSPFPSKDNYDSNSFSSVIELVKFRRKKVQKVFKSLIKSSFSSETPNEINNDNNGPKESAISESYDEDIVSDDISQHYLSHLGTKLSGSDITKTADDDQPIVGFQNPRLIIRLVHDFTAFPIPDGIPGQIQPFVNIHPEHPHLYYPIVYHDSFWTLQNMYLELNDSVKTLPLLIQYNPISMQKQQLQQQFDASFSMQQAVGTSTIEDSDEVRRMLLDSNPYLLGITMLVSIFHMVFDFLAFKNDISFWNNQKDLKGLSVRTIFLNCFCSIIIFLYLWENETSWMILLSSAVGIVIEFWKIRKAANITGNFSGGLFGVFPQIKITDRESYSKSNTSEYDKQAMRYLSYALYPLIICYAIYSLIYQEHKGWYQWVLASLVGSVYTFGFIMMCPQLYINYRLKSVAHLPWRMMTYKALNTVIDDLFAFVISMPTLHRISCFRDDVVFAVFLYQRWIYRIDYTRANEFGYTPSNNDLAVKKDSLEQITDENLNEQTKSSPSQISKENSNSVPQIRNRKKSSKIDLK